MIHIGKASLKLGPQEPSPTRCIAWLVHQDDASLMQLLELRYGNPSVYHKLEDVAARLAPFEKCQWAVLVGPMPAGQWEALFEKSGEVIQLRVQPFTTLAADWLNPAKPVQVILADIWIARVNPGGKKLKRSNDSYAVYAGSGAAPAVLVENQSI